ncbi:hypothetical protein CDAR_31461, partial [Caerostris darwini]
HGETAVHIAAGLGHLNVVKFLHSKKANIRALDSHGDSAIYWAARQGHEQVIRYLYEEGVSVDIQNKVLKKSIIQIIQFEISVVFVLIIALSDKQF